MSGGKKENFEKITTVEQLEELVGFLRSDQGCPWDRKQTARSLKPYFLEEFHELMEAIEAEDAGSLADELGDVLLHLCFQVSLAREAGKFGLEEVVARVRDKMIRRHPHVFGEARFANQKDQLFAWEQIKHNEKSEGAAAGPKSVLDGLSAELPALLKAYRIQGRVSHYHFDWDHPEDLFGKIDEELVELRQAMQSGRSELIEEEIGDLLFTVVNLARLVQVHPQLALERTNRKFIRRFQALERTLAERGLELGRLTLEELDRIWDEVKREEDRGGGSAGEVRE